MRPDPSRRSDERGNLSSRLGSANVLTLVLGIVFGAFFAAVAWAIVDPGLRVAALAAVVLWTAEMLLGALTDDYAAASPRAHAAGTGLLVISQVVACALAFAPEGSMVPLALAGLARLVRRSDRPLLVVMLTVVADACALLAAAHVAGAPTELLIIYLLAGLGVGLLTRLRALRLRAERQERELLHEQLRSQQERATTAALTERARIARDLHDVLAHSLGALTIQLDAAAALAQARRWEGLDARIDRARGLAADGLAESRRAVAALREMPHRDLLDGIDRLLRAHRESGGEVLATLPDDVPEALGDLSSEVTEALLRAVQEMLTNARRHAPGQRVTLDVRVEDEAPEAIADADADAARSAVTPVVCVRASNRVSRATGTPTRTTPATNPDNAATASTASATTNHEDGMTSTAPATNPESAATAGPGGFGLRGMRERCEALGGGAHGHLVDGRTFATKAWVPLKPAGAAHSASPDGTDATSPDSSVAARPGDSESMLPDRSSATPSDSSESTLPDGSAVTSPDGSAATRHNASESRPGGDR